MDDDNWVNLAMSNELLVANLLLQLKHDTLHSPSLPPRCSTKRASTILNCWWSVHRARSTKRHPKSPTKRRFESPKRQAAATGAGKKGEPELKPKPKPKPFSPDTPFSWNGSICTGGTIAATDGRNNNPLDSSRPKVGDQSDQTATTKGSKRKRTSAEVKEEESLLLKKGTDMKNELGSLHHTVEKNGVTNESSKRKLTLKINLAKRKIVTTGTSSMVVGNNVLDQSQLAETHCHPSESVTPQMVQANKVLDDVANSTSKQQEIRNQEPLLLLPDLNMSLGEVFNSQD